MKNVLFLLVEVFWLQPRQSTRRRGGGGAKRLLGGEECDLSRARKRGGRRRGRGREVEGSPRHRMIAGESPIGRGASVSAPLPPLSLQQAWPYVCLSLIFIFIYILCLYIDR